MSRFPAILLLACSVVCLAQTPQIHSGSTVYIEPMGGYETYLASAMLRKQVPIVVVLDRDKADYIIQANTSHASFNNPSSSVTVNNSINTQSSSPGASVQSGMQRAAEEGAAERRALGATMVSMVLIDPKSSKVIFAHSTNKAGPKQLSASAEDCAKHLKDFIQKLEKPKK